MGLSLGGSYGSSDSKSTGTSANTYTPGQSDLQTTLTKAISTMLPGVTSGGISPNVQAMQTQNANTINKTDTGLASRMQKFLSQRGFGQSGESGKVALQSELGRESDLAANNSGAAATQVSQNNGWLSTALNAAFNAIGGSGSSTGSSSGFQVGGGASAKIPGFG